MNKHTVWILWGEDPAEGSDPIEYTFDTEKELQAFLQGIEEGDGWQGRAQIFSNKEPKRTEFDNYNWDK